MNYQLRKHDNLNNSNIVLYIYVCIYTHSRLDISITESLQATAWSSYKTVGGTCRSWDPRLRSLGSCEESQLPASRKINRSVATRNGVYNRARANRTIRLSLGTSWRRWPAVAPADTSSCSRIDPCNRRNVLRWFTAAEYQTGERRITRKPFAFRRPYKRACEVDTQSFAAWIHVEKLCETPSIHAIILLMRQINSPKFNLFLNACPFIYLSFVYPNMPDGCVIFATIRQHAIRTNRAVSSSINTRSRYLRTRHDLTAAICRVVPNEKYLRLKYLGFSTCSFVCPKCAINRVPVDNILIKLMASSWDNDVYPDRSVARSIPPPLNLRWHSLH